MNQFPFRQSSKTITAVSTRVGAVPTLRPSKITPALPTRASEASVRKPRKITRALPTRASERGVLLIELLAYLVILSMVSTAFMSWLNYLQRQHLSTELSQLQLAFLGAQQFAIASGRTVFICLATTDHQCAQNEADATQWLIHHDISQPTSPATATILQTLPRDTKVSLEGRWQVWRVGRDGLMRSWGSWLLCSGSNGAKVTINRGLNFASTQENCET